MPSYTALTNSTSTDTTRRPLVGEEDYKATILEVTEAQKKDFTTGEMKTVWTVKFDVTSFADGAALEDIDGNPVDGTRWLWKDMNPMANGFTAAGEPSAKRAFLLAANGINDMNAQIPGGDTDDLIGREIVLTLRVGTGKDGKQRNYIKGMKAVSRRRVGRAPATASEDADRQAVENTHNNAGSHHSPKDDPYLTAVASLVTGSDDPTDEEVASIAAKVGKRG